MLILLLLQVVIVAHSIICAEEGDILPEELHVGNFISSSNQVPNNTEEIDTEEIVQFQFYYETGCTACKMIYINEVAPIVAELGPYLDVFTYPFGNAQIKMNDTQMTIECQHGQPECYGNMLHACAMYFLGDNAIAFNACMMDIDQNAISNDIAADACGKILKTDAEPIKKCAKSPTGFALLLIFGIDSSYIYYPSTPWWVINGVPKNPEVRRPLKKIICAAFKNPPAACC